MKRKSALAKTASPPPAQKVQKGLLLDVRELIVNARQSVATTVNAALTLLHWQIGKRIREDILNEQRAGYGEEIVATLSQQLETEFGRGFGQRNLFRMVRFAEVFPDPKIVTSLMTQLGWMHFLHLIRFDDPLKCDFTRRWATLRKWCEKILIPLGRNFHRCWDRRGDLCRNLRIQIQLGILRFECHDECVFNSCHNSALAWARPPPARYWVNRDMFHTKCIRAASFPNIRMD